MMLCLDVGNSHIYGGVFAGNKIRTRFRLASKMNTSDEIGVFLKSVLRENNEEPQEITDIVICSVVPQIDYALRAACIKYFEKEPFILDVDKKTGLSIQYSNPGEIGADRIANAIAAVDAYPDCNIIVIDFGTATTFCAINSAKEYIGGAIIPGMRLFVDALASNTAKLSAVDIGMVNQVVGRNTQESIQSGVIYGTLGACREIISAIKQEIFTDSDNPPLVLATGGFASFFENKQLYDHLLPDLVLHGLRLALLMNR